MGLLLFIQMLSFVLLVPDTVTSCGENVCYQDLGCFPNDKPWCTLIRPIPVARSPDEIQTKFYLCTRSSPEMFLVPTWPTISLDGSGYNDSLENVFIVHGFADSVNAKSIQALKNAFLSAIDVNVFLVGWSPGTDFLLQELLQEVSDIRVIGREMARLGMFLINNYPNTTPANFHLIGHSLGAQICSYMGKNISGINRITVLDPAGPFFEGYSNEVHITPGDAVNVDAVHTDGKPLIEGGVAMIGPTGVVDFYVNGGAFQPGCPTSPFAGFAYLDCPHQRALELFVDAVQYTNCTNWGHKTTFKDRSNFSMVDAPPCTLDTCTPMGLRTFDYPARDNGNIFYVGTTGTSPYCIPDKKTDVIMGGKK